MTMFAIVPITTAICLMLPHTDATRIACGWALLACLAINIVAAVESSNRNRAVFVSAIVFLCALCTFAPEIATTLS